MKLDSCPTLYTKINSKWIKDLNLRPETKSPRKKYRGKLPDTGLGNDVLNLTPKAKVTEVKISR